MNFTAQDARELANHAVRIKQAQEQNKLAASYKDIILRAVREYAGKGYLSTRGTLTLYGGYDIIECRNALQIAIKELEDVGFCFEKAKIKQREFYYEISWVGKPSCDVEIEMRED